MIEENTNTAIVKFCKSKFENDTSTKIFSTL